MFNWFLGGIGNAFGSFTSTFIAPVIQAVAPIVIPIIEPIVSVLAPVLTPILEVIAPIIAPVLVPIGQLLAPLINPITDALVHTARQTFDARWETREQIEDQQKANGTYDYSKYDRFEPVVPESEQVQQQTVSVTSLSSDELVETRDAMIAARSGYHDYSEMLAVGAVDAAGYVINESILYSQAGRQTTVPVPGENWSTGEIQWASGRFETIRIMERSGSDTYGGFESNVTLLRNKATGEYTIAVGGTDTVRDALTDLSLIFSEDSGASRAAIHEMIDIMFRDDIPDGATVNLAGHSLGGAEVLLQYRDTPERFDKVYAYQAVGIGGEDGTYFDKKEWDGRGDPNIIEIYGDDADEDFNDMVTYWGHVGAGKVIDIGTIHNFGESDVLGPDLEILDAHLPGNAWASLPGGDNPTVPLPAPVVASFKSSVEEASVTSYIYDEIVTESAATAPVLAESTLISAPAFAAENVIAIDTGDRVKGTKAADTFIFNDLDAAEGRYVVRKFDANEDVIDLAGAEIVRVQEKGIKTVIKLDDGVKLVVKTTEGDFDLTNNIIDSTSDSFIL